MKIEEIIELITTIRDEAREELADMRKQKLSCHSYAAGYEDGTAETCQYLLDIINGIDV